MYEKLHGSPLWTCKRAQKKGARCLDEVSMTWHGIYNQLVSIVRRLCGQIVDHVFNHIVESLCIIAEVSHRCIDTSNVVTSLFDLVQIIGKHCRRCDLLLASSCGTFPELNCDSDFRLHKVTQAIHS